MSHVTLIENDQEIPVKDIAALAKAAERCGLELRQGQETFFTWATSHGRLVGDYPIPQGYTEEDIKSGICHHAIGIPKAEQKSESDKYEIGVVPSRKHRGSYAFMYDFFGGSIDKRATTPEGVKEKRRLDQLYMYYQIEACHNKARREHMVFTETKTDTGIRCSIKKQASF